MKFLRVFCVVLCVRSGDFLHIQNNIPDIRNQNQGAIQVSALKNTEIPVNHPYDDEFRNHPIGRFSEQFKPQKTSEYGNTQQIKNKNEQLLNEEYYTGNQGLYLEDQTHQKLINPSVRSFNKGQYNPREDISKSTLQENMRLESTHISPNYLNWQKIKNTNEHLTNQKNSQSVRQFQTHPKYIFPEAKGFDEVKHTPVEDKTLELQAVSPEYVNSFTNKDKTELNSKLPLTSPYENVNSAAVVKYLDNKQFNSKNYVQQDEAIYENPSAEVLYTTKRALPYEIEDPQIPNISQGDISLYNNKDRKSIQDIQKLMQPSKRYMIIHPDGRVEHTDEIENITKINPNYVMIKSQDFLKHIEGKSEIPGLQIPQLYAQNLHDSIVSQKRSEVPHHLADIPSGQKSLPQFINKPLYTNVTDSVRKLLVSNEPRVYPTQVKTVKVKSHTSPENSNDENQLLNKKHMSTHLLPDIENFEENNNTRNKETIRQLTPYANENEFKNIQSTSVSPRDIQQNQSKVEQHTYAYDAALLSSTIANIPEKNNDNLNKTVKTKVNKTEKASLPFVNLTLKDNLSIPPHNRQIILNNESEQHNLNTLLVPKISTKTADTDNNIKDINQTAALPSINSNKTKNCNGTLAKTIFPNNIQVFNDYSETLPDLNHEMSDTLSTISGPENGVLSLNTTTTCTPIRKETSLSKNNQKENANKNVTNMPTLNITSQSTTPLSNTENTTNNTGFWFQADEQFWQNILSKNDTRNLFYFFFVPPKTNNMQRETKTTLYPNGTTIEEVSETIDEDGVPKVKKTTKVFVNSTSTDA